MGPVLFFLIWTYVAAVPAVIIGGLVWLASADAGVFAGCFVWAAIFEIGYSKRGHKR